MQADYSGVHILQIAKDGQTFRMDVQEIRRGNLEILKKEAGGAAELARRTGVNEAYLSQIKSETTARNMGTDVARRLEREMGKERGWMDADHRAELNLGVRGALSIWWVPEVSWIRAGLMTGIEDPHEPGEGDRWVPTRRQVSPRSFALRVEGDSMVNSRGRPTYPPDCTIIVDPERQWASGDRVVVKIEGVEDATFKQIVRDAGKIWLRPLNDSYKAFEMTEGMSVVGVVVQTILDE